MSSAANKMRDYRKIVAWEKADDLTVLIYNHSKEFPKEEMYALTSQIRRAAYSVAANIVEGASRNTLKDYLHYLFMARGSLAETTYFIHLAHRLEYLSAESYRLLTSAAEETGRILTGLIQSVQAEAGGRV
jgi:four helix bundle protein